MGWETRGVTCSDYVDSSFSVEAFEVISSASGTLGESLGAGEGLNSVYFSISFVAHWSAVRSLPGPRGGLRY